MVAQVIIVLFEGRSRAWLWTWMGRWRQEAGFPTHCGNHCKQQDCGGKGRPNVYRRDKQTSSVFDRFIMFNSEEGG